MHATLAALGVIFQAFAAVSLREPRRPRGELQAVPCGARSDTRLLPVSTYQPLSTDICSVRNYKTGIIDFVEVKAVVIFSDTCSYPQILKINTNTPPQPCPDASALPRRAPARRESAGLPLSALMLTHPRRDPGRDVHYFSFLRSTAACPWTSTASYGHVQPFHGQPRILHRLPWTFHGLSRAFHGLPRTFHGK